MLSIRQVIHTPLVKSTCRLLIWAPHQYVQLLYVTWDMGIAFILVCLYTMHAPRWCPRWSTLLAIQIAASGCGEISRCGSYKRRDSPIPIHSPPQFHILFSNPFPASRDGHHHLLPRWNRHLLRRVCHGHNRCHCGLSRMRHLWCAYYPSPSSWALLTRGAQRSLAFSRALWTVYVIVFVAGKLPCGFWR